MIFLYNLQNYDAYFNSRSRQSGSVALYVRKSYSSHLRPDLSVKEYLESVFVEIKIDTDKTQSIIDVTTQENNELHH